MALARTPAPKNELAAGIRDVGPPVPINQLRRESPGEMGLRKKVVWYVVKNFAKTVGNEKLAPHDLRRTCARLCHVSGGELEQIQFLLGHVSVQTTERYLGCKQKIRDAVNDRIGVEPAD
jgi:integrase